MIRPDLNKHFLPFEEAVALYYLGFDEACYGTFESSQYDITMMSGWFYNSGYTRFLNHVHYRLCSPYYRDAFKFFREKYNIHGEPYLILLENTNGTIKQTKENNEYSFKVLVEGIPHFIISKHIYDSHEEAELACVKEIIEIILHKNKSK